MAHLETEVTCGGRMPERPLPLIGQRGACSPSPPLLPFPFSSQPRPVAPAWSTGRAVRLQHALGGVVQR
jgi:hypothetical protein